jgi:ABC-type multidrug transport system permease subunit
MCYSIDFYSIIRILLFVVVSHPEMLLFVPLIWILISAQVALQAITSKAIAAFLA